VPQSRRRFSLLATRLHIDAVFPKPNRKKGPTVRDVIGPKKGFYKIGPGHLDITPFRHTTTKLSKRNVLRLRKTQKDGGSWLDWADDKDLKRKKYRGIGFIDNYGRMSWDKPAPTITTKFTSISNGRFAHPVENRGISLREGATLQTFPKRYIFPHERLSVSARIIGNAVPPLFAKKLAQTIIKAHTER
jgi:DNA (cytosine-5)-methyltransferase 1